MPMPITIQAANIASGPLAKPRPVRPMAKMITKTLPDPRNATNMITRKNVGNDRTMSTTRISRLSTLPPTYPATDPTAVPMNTMIRTATPPIINDVCNAFIKR